MPERARPDRSWAAGEGNGRLVVGAARRCAGALTLSALVHLLVAASWLRSPPARAEPLAEPVPAASSVPLTGDTFDLGIGEEADEPAASAPGGEPSPTPSPPPSPSPSPGPAVPAAPGSGLAPRPPPPTPVAASAPSPGGAAESSSAPSLYGAVGERSAVDLVPAFQRAFAQTASADPAWQAAALGSGGKASLAIVLDDTGHIASSALGAGASAALTSSVQRTLALLAHRSFVARGARTTLHLSAHVTADTVHDGLHGDRFALGVGETAWFALPSGRRIDLHVTAAR